MTKYRVLIPDEYYSILEFEDENLPGIAVVNTALKGFEPKEVFCWQLSIIIDLQDLIENGMPSAKEVQVIDEFGDYLDKEIKGADEGKPNALFLKIPLQGHLIIESIKMKIGDLLIGICRNGNNSIKK
ncbi:DUF695 domain-containing protein [Sphingobacterium endophyticum]|uniref:DUF695 domain-containing protein n=1 Tax=Sphingobacterium endophyticum TaxID=2546448 RepID=UPI0018CF8C40|nr:DUF695 domain-containing protein [Sphingobacterium endophyticum]